MSAAVTDTLSRVYAALSKRNDCTSKNDGQCEKPSVLSGAQMAVAICIPVVVVACLLGGLAFRAYKVNKKEEKEFQNDPDFYKNYEEYINTTDMPAYPPPAYQNHSMINNDSTDQINVSNKSSSALYPPSMAHNNRGSSLSVAGGFNSPNNSQLNLSRSSLNPFDSKDDRYPSGTISNNGSSANLNERKLY